MEFQSKSFKKIHFKMSSGKWRPVSMWQKFNGIKYDVAETPSPNHGFHPLP